MKCRLSIISGGTGWNEKLVKTAEYSYDDGYAQIIYFHEGDRCVLTLSKLQLEHKRTGNACISLSLKPDEETVCVIGGAELKGGYRMKCLSLNVSFTERGCAAETVYLSGDDGERVNMKIRAIL